MLGVYRNEKLNTFWVDKEYSFLKKDIKELLLEKSNVCAYCRIPFPSGKASKILIHIEHILPKDEYPFYTFYLKNLSLSCQRCNMTCKGRRKDHIVNYRGKCNHSEDTDFLESNYHILHPNIHYIDGYYKLKLFPVGNSFFYHYEKKVDNNPKLDFTFSFFKLHEIEESYIDYIQGLDSNNLKREEFGLDKVI